MIRQELEFTQDLDYIIDLYLREYELNNDSSIAPKIWSAIQSVMSN